MTSLLHVYRLLNKYSSISVESEFHVAVVDV